VSSAPALWVGTSGWSYREWRGTWYPPELPRSRWLPFYAERFATVELNSSFYRLPRPEQLQRWAADVQEEFLFAVKAPRQITHEQRLQHCDELVREFLQRITLLGKRLGPILWQLPPNLLWHPGVLEQFLALLPESLRYAVEFRHPSWDRPEVWELLRSRGIATVWSSSLRYPLFLQATADFLYLRFHGLHGGFAHRYTREELLPWVERVCTALRQGMSVYAYFNNTAGGAAEDAAHFRTLVLQHL